MFHGFPMHFPWGAMPDIAADPCGSPGNGLKIGCEIPIWKLTYGNYETLYPLVI